MRARSRKRILQPEAVAAPLIAKSAGVATDDDDALLLVAAPGGVGDLLKQLGTTDHRLRHRQQESDARRQWLRIERDLVAEAVTPAKGVRRFGMPCENDSLQCHADNWIPRSRRQGMLVVLASLAPANHRASEGQQFVWADT